MSFLSIKAWHVISMVAWFAGLFYLPRLFVYHAECYDQLGHERFVIMERRLYRGIMWPAALMTTIFGLWLLVLQWPYYRTAYWMHAKLLLVLFLWVYHLICGRFVRQFRHQPHQPHQPHQRSSRFYRFFNEIPTLFLITIVFLVILKPSW